MEIDIREGVLTAQTFLSLRAACGMPELEPELVERAVKASLLTLTAVGGGRAVGMARVVGDGAFVFLLYDLLVVPLWRRQGIGSMLADEALRRVKAFVPPGRSLVMGLFSGEGRESFYTRLGFTELPAPGLGAGMQAVCV